MAKWDPIESAKGHSGLAIRSGRYYWQQMVQGKRHNESLGVDVGTKAQETQALRVLASKRAALTENRIADYEAMRVKRTSSTIGELFTAYEKYALRRGLTASWKGNPQALRCVVATAKGIAPESVEALGLDTLTADLMLAFESQALVAGLSPNTIVSCRRKSRALFARKARVGYGALSIPDCVEGFLAAGDVRERVQEWQRPAADLVAKTKAAARELREQRASPDLQVAYLLCYALGLRAKEVAACRWDWFDELDGKLVCWVKPRPQQGFKPKGRSGYVPVPDVVWEWLQELRVAGQDTLLSGTDFGRYDFIQRELSAWMRGLGWTSQHCAHELRRLRGCEWWEDPSVGPALCSEWLRHSSLLVTQRHYGKPALPEKTVSIDL